MNVPLRTLSWSQGNKQSFKEFSYLSVIFFVVNLTLVVSLLIKIAWRSLETTTQERGQALSLAYKGQHVESSSPDFPANIPRFLHEIYKCLAVIYN